MARCTAPVGAIAHRPPQPTVLHAGVAIAASVVMAGMAAATAATDHTRPLHTPPQGAAAVGAPAGRGAAPQSRAGREQVRLCGTRLNKCRRSRRFEKTWRT